jgi:hypothetical protein
MGTSGGLCDRRARALVVVRMVVSIGVRPGPPALGRCRSQQTANRRDNAGPWQPARAIAHACDRGTLPGCLTSARLSTTSLPTLFAAEPSKRDKTNHSRDNDTRIAEAAIDGGCGEDRTD